MAAPLCREAGASGKIVGIYLSWRNSDVKGAEREALDYFIAAFEIVPVDQTIASMGGLNLRDYGKSHGVGLADAIIAATAEVRKADLVTLNKKHFPMLTNIIVPYQK